MRLLPRMTGAGMLTPGAWDRIASILESNFREVILQKGPGYTVTTAPGGTTLNIAGNSASPSFPKLPFYISLGGTSEAPTLTLWPGTVNGIMPENMFESFTVDSTSLWYAKATVDTSGGVVQSVTINVDTSAPDKQTPASNDFPTGFDVLLGLYKGGMIYNIAGGIVSLTANQINAYDGSWQGVWAIG